MSKLVKIAEEQIISSVTAAIKNNIADGTFIEVEIPSFKTEIPADRKNGDYSTNAAMAHARAFRLPPVKIAEAITENLDLKGTYFEKCEIAGAGFMNFTLSGDYYRDIINALSLDPAECLMVGNDVGEDMIAERLGMQVFLLTDCIINKANEDISKYPHGNFDDLTAFLLQACGISPAAHDAN